VLTLDDPRWPSLDHRGWSDGGRSRDEDAPFVPDELRHLQANPTDRARFQVLWPYLCSEDTSWPAAYAAVPYLVAIAEGLRPADRGDYLYVVGLIVMCSGEYGHVWPGIPDDVTTAYRAALPTALTLLTEQLATPHGLTDTRYYLAAAAALKGHTGLAELLNDLNFYTECQECGEPMIDLPDGLTLA